MADVQTLPPPQYPSLTPRRQEVEYVVLADAHGTAETSLQDYLRLFWRRKWLLLLPVVCIMPWMWLLVATQPPRYSAKATVLIEDTTPKVLAIPEVMGPEKSPNFIIHSMSSSKVEPLQKKWSRSCSFIHLSPPEPIPPSWPL